MMEHVTIREAAAHLGVTELTVRRRMRRGELEHGKDERGRIWVGVTTRGVGDATQFEQSPVNQSTLQLIKELTEERDRWVAEAAAKQATIDLLFQQAENYQVLLYEAQSQVKRLSAPREKPPLLMERIDRRQDDSSELELPTLSANVSAEGIKEAEPAPVQSKRPRWWRW